MKHYCPGRLSAVLLICMLCLCSGCGNGNSGGITEISYTPGETQVLIPEASGDVTAGTDPLTLDFSHVDQGYFMGILSEEGTKVNIQVTGPDGVVYKYFLSAANTPTAFPFTAGDGTYIIMTYENITGDQYAALFSYSLDVTLANEFLPFLYPNQYVSFTADSEAILLAAELSADAESDLDALSSVYNYVTDHITYDMEKAETVAAGYLPDIDETLETGTGICFDYAALMTAMLRSLSIPSRLNIGYSGSVYHAWIDVYIESVGWVKNAVQFSGDDWTMMDPTFAAALDDDDDISEYIGDGSQYTTLYVR